MFLREESGKEAYEKGTGEGAFNSGGLHDSLCTLKAAVGHEKASALTSMGIQKSVGDDSTPAALWPLSLKVPSP